MKILVVDDEAVLVKGISYNLRNDGYEVLTGSNGMDAVRTVRETPVDLVILDVMMPRWTGWRPAVRSGIFPTCPSSC